MAGDVQPESKLRAWIVKLIGDVVADLRVQQAIKNIVGGIIAERVVPLVPLAVGAAVQSAIDKVPGAQGLVDLVETTDAARDELNRAIPDVDFGIPALDAVLDFWRPR